MPRYELNLTMRPELKHEWIEALRSGEYEQGTGVLQDDLGHYCCLGVLCDISEEGTWEYSDGAEAFYHFDDDEGSSVVEVLTNFVLDAFGLPNETANLLMGLNDGHEIRWEFINRSLSFNEIADIIEKGTFNSEEYFNA